MSSFRLWVVALHSDYENKIVMYLVKKGYKISPLADSGALTEHKEGYMSATIAIRVETTKEIKPNVFRDFVSKDLTNLGVKFHALIIENGGAYWSGSNIEIPKPEPIMTGHPYR